jgi:molybdopterin converting factor small subunit
MRVNVELQAHLDQYAPDGEPRFQRDLSEGASVGQLIRSLGMPEEMACVIIVNDTSTGPEQTLHEGDRVNLIPALAGG